jgi:TfoX/Sxy family transcriptional regulator of competence genes
MATKQSTVDYILDQLSGMENIRARKMFGEYALYANEKVVALVCDDELFVKITEAGKKLLGKNYAEGFAYPGAKPSMRVSADLFEDQAFLRDLISITAQGLPEPKPKKRKNN